jgi:hypothetical protein
VIYLANRPRHTAAAGFWRFEVSTAERKRPATFGSTCHATFLKAVGRAGLAAIALPAGVLPGGPGVAQSRLGATGGRQPLIQPREIRSENGGACRS